MKRRAFLGAMALGALAPSLAHARSREIRALSIANNYSATPAVPSLPNTLSDSELFRRAVLDLNSPRRFRSIQCADFAGLNDGINDWLATQVAATDIVLLHYAGHGVQIGGQNFLVANNGREFVRFTNILRRIREAATDCALIAFLDSCRNNPFAHGTAELGSLTFYDGIGVGDQSVRIDDPRTLGEHPFSDGMSEYGAYGQTGVAGMQDDPGVPEEETMVCFAAQPGRTANDNAPGLHGNGPFSWALSQHLKDKVEVQQVMTKVTQDVRALTAMGGHEPQVPMRVGSISQPIYLAGYERPEGASFVP